MNKNPSAAIALFLAALAAPAAAQGIYRCGDSYSQKPCPGGRLVEAEDSRSAAQGAQTSQAAQRDAQAADAMEKARLKEEAKPAQVLAPPARSPAAGAGETKAGADSTLKKPATFNATAPAKPDPGAAKAKKKKAKAKAPPA